MRGLTLEEAVDALEPSMRRGYFHDPPDGGHRAWMAVIAGNLIFMNTGEVVNSFGLFQPYHTDRLSESSTAVSWIGSLQIFFLFSIGIVTGRLTDLGHFRPTLVLGSALIISGNLAVSWASKYWHFLLAHCVCVWIGNGCLFDPGFLIMISYISRKTGLAVAVASAGSATGGLVYPSIIRQLIPSVGFAWVMRILASVLFITMVAIHLLLSASVKPEAQQHRFDIRDLRHLINPRALRRLDLIFYATGSFLGFWGIFFAFYYLASYGQKMLGMSYTQSLNLLLLLNGLGVVGRLLLGYLADHIAIFNVLVPTTFTVGVLTYSWYGIHSTSTYYVWTCIYSLEASGFQTLFPTGLRAIVTVDAEQGATIGLVLTVVSFAALTGSPIADALAEVYNGSYLAAQMFAGSCIVLSSAFFLLIAEVKEEGAIRRVSSLREAIKKLFGSMLVLLRPILLQK